VCFLLSTLCCIWEQSACGEGFVCCGGSAFEKKAKAWGYFFLPLHAEVFFAIE
jgi:hypothetical protein